MLITAVVSLAFALPTIATPHFALFTDFVTKHSWGTTSLPPSTQWVYHSTPNPTSLLTLRLSLRSSNYDVLLEHLTQTSDPLHSRYGQHLTKEQADELMRPTDETVDEVKRWLRWNNIDDDAVHFSGNVVHLIVPVSYAEALLNTTYAWYSHVSDPDNKVVRTLAYSLPRHLHDHIDLVSPTTYFGNLRSMYRKRKELYRPRASALISPAPVPKSCADVITPACLQSLYNTKNFSSSITPRHAVGVTGYLEEYASEADLVSFRQKYLPGKPNANMTIILVNGGQNLQIDPGTEANLDVQYVYGVSLAPITFYSVGGRPPFSPDDASPINTNEPYLDWLDFIGNLNNDEVPKVISNSYGDDEQTVPEDYAKTVCAMFSRLGVRGVSVIFASGDVGVGNGDCVSNDGSNKVVFQPSFPASCPFVTAVGGTTGISPEVATGTFASGGGFSTRFPQPTYQANAVSKFLSQLGSNTYSGLFNAAGRAYPDVSAQGQAYQVFWDGFVESVDGTSCATPTFAGVVALLNEYRNSTLGKSSLGFLNPLIYANPLAFNDITSGSNPGCSTNGFSAVKGWDPVTGLGTPDFEKLQGIV